MTTSLRGDYKDRGVGVEKRGWKNWGRERDESSKERHIGELRGSIQIIEIELSHAIIFSATLE